MLIRKVLMNGQTYSAHRVSTVCIGGDGWMVYVDSFIEEADASDPAKSPVSRAFLMERDTDSEIAEAYAYIASLPEFAEYSDSLDEVLAILTDEQAEQVPDAFPEWRVGVDYAAGYRARYANLLYKCLSAHTSQEGWEPPVAVSLWARVGGGDIPEWVQPTSANPYMRGDVVRHGGKIWESLIDNNVWEPGTAGTENLWREVS